MLLDHLSIKAARLSSRSEKEEGEDAAAQRLRCSDVFSKTVIFFSFLFLIAGTYYFFCLPDGRVFWFVFALYILRHIYKKNSGLNKIFSGFFFFLFEDFGVALWSHDCLAFVCQRGCAAAVRLGMCVCLNLHARVLSPSHPYPSLSFSSSTSFIHKLQQLLTAIFTLASSC